LAQLKAIFGDLCSDPFPMQSPFPLLRRFGEFLVRLGHRLAPAAESPPERPVVLVKVPLPSQSGSGSADPVTSQPLAESRTSVPPAALFSPASREPLTVEGAVLSRSMALLKREAADSLAALGAAHALVTSARLSQVQHLREQVERGAASADALAALAADYQGWQNDQVRLFDAMALVLRMSVPTGTTLELVDPQLHEQARAHLASLSTEYQRGLLLEQFRDAPSAPEA
jgi:hypothetical protein